MVATFGSLTAKRKVRHYIAAGFRAVQACDGRSIQAIYVNSDDPTYVTCSRCAKLTQEVK